MCLIIRAPEALSLPENQQLLNSKDCAKAARRENRTMPEPARRKQLRMWHTYWVLLDWLNERAKDNSEEAAGSASQAARSAHAGAGTDFHAPSGAGSHHPDPPLQSRVHVLQ